VAVVPCPVLLARGVVPAECLPAGAGEAFRGSPGEAAGAGEAEKAGGLGPELDTLWWPVLSLVSVKAIAAASAATTIPAAMAAWPCRGVRDAT
jgi:hypothetical protein